MSVGLVEFLGDTALGYVLKADKTKDFSVTFGALDVSAFEEIPVEVELSVGERAEAVAFENPDGIRVVVFVVPGENPRARRQIQFKVDGTYHALSVPEHSITTFVLKK